MKKKNADNQQKNSKKRVIGRPFPKGVSGNPKGRPKGRTIKEQVRHWLKKHPDDEEEFVKYFIKRNRELAWQMLEGRPKQPTEHTGEGGGPIKFIVGVDDGTIKSKTTSKPIQDIPEQKKIQGSQGR